MKNHEDQQTTVTVAAGQESKRFNNTIRRSQYFLNAYNASAIAKDEWTIELE